MTERPSQPWLHYLVALGVLTAAVVLRLLFDPVLGDRLPLVTLYGAVAFAVWLGGWGPAVLIMVLGYAVTDLLFSAPRFRLDLLDPAALVGLAAYLLSCGIIIGFGEAMRRARQAERRSALDANRRREQLSVTLESIGDAVIATDRAGRVTFLNPVAAQLTGWKQDDAAGVPLPDVFRIVNEHTRQPVENPAERALATGQVVGLANHTALIARDGTEHAIGDSAAPIRDKDGTVTGVILVFRDVGERRQQQIALRQLAAIVESSADAIIANNLEGIVTSWNPAAEQLYGYTAQEMLGRPKAALIPPDRADELAHVLEAARSGRRVGPYETERLRKDGSRIDVSITASPFRDDAAEIVGVATIARDITERKRSEAALREADRRKDEFLATLAHELRNPLAALSNALHALRLGKDAALQEGARRVMERQLTHLVRLVDDLLDVSRITTGKIELRRERVALPAIVDAAVETSQALIEQRGQRLTVTLPDTPIVVDADPTRMAQVLANLLNNAAKYTDRGGHLALTVRRERDEAVITVEDDGIGIAPEMLPRLFEIFSQAHPADERSQGGLGIGLSLVRALVRLHGGSVAAHSDGLGRGSRFTVRLPVATEAPAVATESSSQPPAHGAARRILVVDDNRDSAETMAILLGLKGHAVRTAHDGVQAIETAQRFRPEVVLLDIGLPGGDGYEVARRLRSEAGLVGARLVATTGWGYPEDKRRAREAGFDLHLTKPVDMTQLERLLGSIEPSAPDPQASA
jgi:PAS domain S-box-containing protein